MRTLYFDCFAGASGNMILGALIAAGVEREKLIAALKQLKVDGFEIYVEMVDRSGISSTHVDVHVPHEHVHRHLRDIKAIISASGLSDSVKQRSTEIFTRLAEAEAKVHGIGVEQVHFHEVGAMDAIVDVVGACVGFEMLGVERFACSKIHVGSGFVDMAHGKFPVPPPAVAELLTGIPTYSTEVEGELITPTGAAIISAVCTSYGTQPEMTVEKTSYGAGTRKYEKFPNVLRLMLGESTSADLPETLTLLETNIDDLSPQVLGFVMDRAFEKGALDCWFTPIQMKKNRPATTLSVLCEANAEAELSRLIYSETTTLGIRTSKVQRSCLEREIVTVDCEYGTIAVKIALMAGEAVNVMPEYDDVAMAAARFGVPFRDVSAAAIAAYGSGEKSEAAGA
jgi:pyridinium-3,5-bisthiocarboxylic acid mononucleotide nickel chelatase